MTRYAWLALLFQLPLGACAFGGLFASDLAIGTKLFLGASLLLIAFMVERSETEAIMFHDEDLKLTELLFSILDRGSPEEKKPADVLIEHARAERFRFVAGGEGESHFWVLMGQYVVWLVGGWLLAMVFASGRQ